MLAKSATIGGVLGDLILTKGDVLTTGTTRAISLSVRSSSIMYFPVRRPPRPLPRWRRSALPEDLPDKGVCGPPGGFCGSESCLAR